MSVQINVNRFSRDKRLNPDNDNASSPIQEPEPTSIQEAPLLDPPKKKRGRKKAVITEEVPSSQPMVEEPPSIIDDASRRVSSGELEDVQHAFDDSFLDDLKVKPDPPAIEVPKPPEVVKEEDVESEVDIFDYIEGKAPRKPKAKKPRAPPKLNLDDGDDFDLRDMISHKPPSRVTTKPKHMDPDFKDIMDKKGSAILGKDKRELLVKIAQYKQLFPDELANFKVKQNASHEELQQYLDECDVIVGCSAMESFATDSILTGIQIVEGVSARTQSMNITGTSHMLKANPQFHKLCKQLYLKYGVFSQIPPEMQLIMLISTTAMVARSKNLGMHSDLNGFLDQPVS